MDGMVAMHISIVSSPPKWETSSNSIHHQQITGSTINKKSLHFFDNRETHQMLQQSNIFLKKKKIGRLNSTHVRNLNNCRKQVQKQKKHKCHRNFTPFPKKI